MIFAILVIVSFPSNSLSQQIKSQRIVSLAPSTTEILFALGLDDEIVGVTINCNYPSEAKDKEKVGTFSQPDIEKILSLKPDIIFATGLEQALTVEQLRQLRFKVYISDPSNMQGLFTSIREIGNLTRREKEAEILINLMRNKIDQIRAKVKFIPQNKRPKVFIEIWHDPLMTTGKCSFVDELINLAGGINIACDVFKAYSYISPEIVIKRDPDCIILGHRSKAETLNIIKNQLGWKEIKAIKNNCIYNDINPDLFLRPGPRLVQGLEEIYQKLYPAK